MEMLRLLFPSRFMITLGSPYFTFNGKTGNLRNLIFWLAVFTTTSRYYGRFMIGRFVGEIKSQAYQLDHTNII